MRDNISITQSASGFQRAGKRCAMSCVAVRAAGGSGAMASGVGYFQRGYASTDPTSLS